MQRAAIQIRFPVAVRKLSKRNVSFKIELHLIANMEDHDLWMPFLERFGWQYARSDARGAERLSDPRSA
jgi:hypothetical protein